MKRKQKTIVSLFLALLMAVSGIMPVITALADDGVEGYYNLEIFYADTNTIVPSYGEDGETEYVEYMREGDELKLTYKLIDSVWPDNGKVKWYSNAPELVDVTQEGVVKAFDSSKGAVIHAWINNEVRPIPIIGGVMAKVIEKALFNDYVNIDTLDTEAIVDIVVAALGSDSFISDYIEAYQGQLVDSLREYLDKVNSEIHCELYDSTGAKVSEDVIRVNVLRCEDFFANFLPNGTHITNKSQISTVQAKGAEVQLYAITTPQRLNFGVVYSVKSTSIFNQGKSVATVTDGGLVQFRNVGTVTILASPDSEQVIQKILELVNYFYKLENTGTLNTDKIAEILIKYMGVDINRAVLAGILDAAFAIYKVVGDTADPVQLTATAVEVLANIILQMKYNDSITFTVEEASPITDFTLGGQLTVREGTQSQLTIENLAPTTGDKSDLVWESSDPSIASVDEKGVVTGLDAGGSLGQLSSAQCEITCISTTNNIRRTVTVTVTGKTGKYISGCTINGPDLVEIDSSQDYSYSIYPSRVAEADNLYVTWGMLTGEDEEGEPIYTWADKENPVSDGIGSIDYMGHYTTIKGGSCTIAFMAKTGYYLSNGEFFEISNKIVTKTIMTGIPVESIHIAVTGGTGVADKSIDSDKIVNINGVDYEYCTAQISVGTAYDGKGAALTADVYPATATNKNLRWVVDNGNYKMEDLSEDTHSVKVKQKAAHEVADTFNVYAVSQDGKVRSNVITVCVTRNMATGNSIDADHVDMINGKSTDLTHTMSFSGSWQGEAYACYRCNWYSSDESVVSVTQKGNGNRDAVLHANDVGTATIYCVSTDGAFVDSVEVTVRPDKQYLSEIINLCDRTIVLQTAENKADYKKYMRKLDLAYTIYFEEEMAAQATCDTYAQELLYAFIRVGGFVGINGVEVLGTNKTKLDSDFVTVKVSSTKNYKNYSYDFDYTVYPAGAMYSTVEWSSSDSSIRVDKNGRCTPTGNSACTAVITCTITDYNGTTVTASKRVAFARTKATGVELSTNEISGAKIGETQKITATVLPTNALGKSDASVTDVLWHSTNPTVASVNDKGEVTFNYGGTAVIVATTCDGGKTAECVVTVVTNYDRLRLLVNQYKDLSLNPVNYYPETWSTYTTALAKAESMLQRGGYTQEQVDAMYAELEGAYKGLKKYVYIQNVELYLDGEATSDFYQYDLSLLKEGISYKNAKLNLKVRLYPNNASYQSVSWRSETDSISVSTSGVASPTSNKSCYGLITCTVKDHFGMSYQDTVWVSFSYRPVTGIVLGEDNINGNIGDTHQLSYRIMPDGTDLLHQLKADIQDHYWESDDESVATVDDNGLVTFVGAGSTKVRCVSYDGGHFGECVVSTNGDRSALNAAIEQYKDIDYRNYEYDYAIAFKNAYEAAQNALTDVTLTQVQIDRATNNLVSAGSALASHPYIPVTSIPVSYQTYKRSSSVVSWSSVSSGSVTTADAVSVDLSGNSYASNNSNNRVVLNAVPAPANSMYKTIAWTVEENYQMDIGTNGSEIAIVPSKNDGAYAIVRVTVTDHFGSTTSRRIFVVMADNVASGMSLTSSTSLVMYPTDAPQQITYAFSGSPRFTQVYFTSSDTSVATVNGNGVITAVDKGSAVITAKSLDGGYTRTVSVIVNTDFSRLAEKTNEYRALIDDVQDDYAYTEESLNALLAEVVASDEMIREGKATQAEVNAQLASMNNAYNSLVRLIAAEGVSIINDDGSTAVSEPNPGFIRYSNTVINNKTVQLAAVTRPANSLYSAIEWVSDSETITVNDDGLVTNGSASSGVAKISCIVTNAFNQRYSASVYVAFVRDPVKEVTFDTNMIYGAPQEKKQLTPNLNQGNRLQSAVVNDCLYSSSNPAVATIDEEGVITFITQGVSTITVTSLDGGFKGTIVAKTTWDTTALQEAIRESESIDYMAYEYSYGTAFKTAYDTAVAVYKNPDAPQQDINVACYNLVEAKNALEGHEFIATNVQLFSNGNSVQDGKACEVDENNRITLTYGTNLGAMYKSITVTAEGEGFTQQTVNGNLVLTRTSNEDTEAKLIVTIVDPYDRETVKEYDVVIVDQIINITSIQLFADGELVGTTINKSFKRYADFTGMQMSYQAMPYDATKPASVTWTSSAPNYIQISETGLITLSNLAIVRSSNTANITCTVTNNDGTKVSATVQVTISRS